VRPQGSPISLRPLRGAIPRTSPGPKLCLNVVLINTTQHQSINTKSKHQSGGCGGERRRGTGDWGVIRWRRGRAHRTRDTALAAAAARTCLSLCAQRDSPRNRVQGPRTRAHTGSAAHGCEQRPGARPCQRVYPLKVFCLHPSPLRGGRGKCVERESWPAWCEPSPPEDAPTRPPDDATHAGSLWGSHLQPPLVLQKAPSEAREASVRDLNDVGLITYC